ncbi:D-alanyl-D-alanine-carboxypeptidase/endopeptidase AmpH [Granulicella sp. L60]|uniref:D-alanyl-D-alanine- carboxypeptidase/endopeptidase AmpH n=1 Tax=Granulicella sp. L60 TaxID=1641866 RepID=UPI00131AED42|nr:D-alanyl-D-alanine-carboxypeptidase/endopeptidase AmpH [Granulicella sp. L60]
MSHSKFLRTLFFFFLLPLTSTCVQVYAQTSLPNLQSIDALGSDLFLQSGSTGMVLVVVRDNQVFFHGYGETAPNSRQAPTQDSLLRLCSLTKIFTTDVLTKLVTDKTVRLDDPLQRFSSPHIVVPKHIQPITLADLATHTSGLPRELGNAPPGSPHFTFPDYRTRWRWLPNQRLRSTPGTAALYSNVAFDFLSDALQAATHKQYAALLAERTLNPLHMQHTTFFPSAEQCSHLLLSTNDEGPCTVTEPTAGSSGLYSTAADMAIWLQYLLGTRGPGDLSQDPAAQAIYILPSHLVSQKGLDHAGEPTGIGLGWIHILPVNSPSHIIEKTGGGGGFETYIAINHSQRTAIFLAATDGSVDTHLNLFNGANKLLLAVAGLPPLPPPQPKPAPKRSLKHRRR